jgi:hypothetical protein
MGNPIDSIIDEPDPLLDYQEPSQANIDSNQSTMLNLNKTTALTYEQTIAKNAKVKSKLSKPVTEASLAKSQKNPSVQNNSVTQLKPTNQNNSVSQNNSTNQNNPSIQQKQTSGSSPTIPSKSTVQTTTTIGTSTTSTITSSPATTITSSTASTIISSPSSTNTIDKSSLNNAKAFNNDSLAGSAITKSIPLIETRKKAYFKEIDLDNGKIQVEVYDNGTIDYDSVSLYLNGKEVLAKTMLNHKSVKLTLQLDPNIEFNELGMFAENLGMIPPNTAAMIIHDGKKEYQVLLQSDFSKSATLKLKVRKNIP